MPEPQMIQKELMFSKQTAKHRSKDKCEWIVPFVNYVLIVKKI